MRTSITLAGLALVLLCTPVMGQAPVQGVGLAGSVHAEGYRGDGRLVGAMVEVRQPSGVRYTTVDSRGRYRVEGLTPGPAHLFVFHVAAFPLQMRVRLPDDGDLHLDLSLRHRVIELRGIAIRAPEEFDDHVRMDHRIPPLQTDDRPGVQLALRSLESSSGIAESGLVSALASREPVDREGALLLRGSTLDNRVVLLDGAPILTPFHVAGLIEPFEPTWLGETKVFVGGAPSPYSGGLSYLLDVGTRPANRDELGGSVAVDGLTARASLETPLPMNGGMLLGSRWMHGLQSTLMQGVPFPYDYGDVLMRAGMAPAPGHEVRVTGFGNVERVRLDLGDDPAAVHRARWGNRAISLGYEGWFGNANVEATLAGSRYRNLLPLAWDEPVLAQGTGDRYRFETLVELPVFSGALRTGGTLELVEFAYGFQEIQPSSQAVVRTEPLATNTTVIGGFVEWEGHITPELELRAGGRADHYSHEDEVRFSPRGTLRYHLGPDAEVFASVGLYHQVVPVPGLWSLPGDGDVPPALGWNPRLAVAQASHLVMGLDQRIEEQFLLGVSGFVKSFSDLGPGAADPTRASGMELRVTREGDRLSAWVGYALSWFWEEGGFTRAATFEGRHLVSAGLDTQLPTGALLRGSVGYGAGLPWTAVSVSRPGVANQIAAGFVQNLERDSNTLTDATDGAGVDPLELASEGRFLRLDLEVGWPLDLQMGGRETRIRPYLKIMNALDRRDALFYYLDQWENEEARPIAEQTVLPLAGVEWVF